MEWVSPAIFVPVDKSLLEPFDAPRDKIERLKLSLSQLDQHSVQVRSNLMFLFVRERDRILQEVRIQEAKYGLQATQCKVEDGERNWMLQNMAAPINTSRNYSVAKPPPMPLDQPINPPATLRAAAIEELIGLVEGAVKNFEGYNWSTSEARKDYENAIERERVSEARAFSGT